MKTLLMLLALASTGRAAVEQTVSPVGLGPITGCNLRVTNTTQTFALNMALTGTSATAIDTSTMDGIQISITGTAGLVEVGYGNETYTAASNIAFTIDRPGGYCLPILGRYVVFTNAARNRAGAKITLGYVGAYQAGATAATAGAAANPTSPTASLLSAYLTVSDTVRTVSSSDIPLAITSLAGSATGMYRFEFSTLGPCAGVYWATNQTNAAPPVYHYAAASATALADVDLASGEHLHFLRGSASDCTTKIVIKKRTAQAP